MVLVYQCVKEHRNCFCLAAGLVPAIKPLTYAVAILEVRQDSNLHLLFRVSQADTNHKRLPFSRLSLIVLSLNYAPCDAILFDVKPLYRNAFHLGDFIHRYFDNLSFRIRFINKAKP